VLRITLKKIDTLGKFVDALTQSEKGGSDQKAEAGINVNAIEWETSKKEELSQLALADAVRMARKKAEDIAKAAGVKIKSVHRINHSALSSSSPRPYLESQKVSAAMAADRASSTEMLEGQIKIRAVVDGEYTITQ
jgi:uncharacterized protein